ncbi:hypothetical protein FSP39_002255 [Pinctada imbricata]|uniref:E3 ubiquitin-protein ligase RNF10 n=1 Tax=Pinctada imbricata TaxID=66713 RepID=A0AA88XEF1_PINIB|nr:hypothetical protein FSP39_002255 [Pinctada imbricata]
MPKEGERGRLGQKEGDFSFPRGRNAKEGDEFKKRESPSKRGRVDRKLISNGSVLAAEIENNGIEMLERPHVIYEFASAKTEMGSSSLVVEAADVENMEGENITKNQAHVNLPHKKVGHLVINDPDHVEKDISYPGSVGEDGMREFIKESVTKCQEYMKGYNTIDMELIDLDVGCKKLDFISPIHIMEWVIEDYRTDYESVLTSRKKVDLNHLLNFTYTRPQSYRDRQRWPAWDYGGGRNKRTYYKSSYNKEQFLQANCQFIVKVDGDYAVHHIDPDTLVDWDAIELVRVYSHEKPSCPICLEEPTAAKITRCGHIYCWPCILHYLALGEKTWRKCPICYESIHDHDLKSVVTEDVKSYKVGDIITMKLMRREKGTTYAVPAENWEKRDGKFHNINDATHAVPYVKLLTASKEDIKTAVIEKEKVMLDCLQQQAETSEMAFIEGCFHKLKEREELLDKGSNVVKRRLSDRPVSSSSDDSQTDVQKPDKDNTSSKTKPEAKPCKQYASAFSDEEDIEEDKTSTDVKFEKSTERGNEEQVSRSSICSDEGSVSSIPDVSEVYGSPEGVGGITPVIPEDAIPVEEAAEHLEIPLAMDDSTASKREENHDSYYFYQAADGQRIYLHAVNARCLVREYGALQFSPLTITGRILETENIFMSEELRKRLRYLGHLPLTSEFEVAELDLKPPTLSKNTLKFFADDIERRKRLRQKKFRQERRWSKKIQDKEKKKMGITPGMTIVRSQFMENVRSENRPVSPAAKSDDSSQSTSSLVSPVGSPLDIGPLPVHEEDEGQQTSMSFAQMLKGGSGSTPVWPKLSTKSEPPRSTSTKPQGGDSEGSDAEEKVHTTVYSLGDAMQIALDNLNKSKDDDSQSPVSSGMTKLPGKKKKKQQKLLFTTSMARGGTGN